MSIPLRVLSSSDSFAVLTALTDVIDGTCALFVRSAIDSENFGDVDEHIALIVESSGSTGSPKRIEISRAALLASARASIERIGEPGQWLLALPTHFIAGLQVLTRSVLSDHQPVLMNPSLPFTAEGFARSASLMTASHRYTSLVPTQLDTLAAAIDTHPEVLSAMQRFDRILIGGQAPNENTMKRLRELEVKLTVTYGMTETCGGCVYDGIPLNGVEVDIDEAGHICIAGPMLAEGLGERYVTNDLGLFDSGNRLRILGRSDRVINSGGLKLSLERVEQWALAQPGVSEAAAVALDQERFGQTFACWYVAGATTVLNADECAAELGLPAKKSGWRKVERIPLLASGKPDLVSIRRAEEELATSADN